MAEQDKRHSIAKSDTLPGGVNVPPLPDEVYKSFVNQKSYQDFSPDIQNKIRSPRSEDIFLTPELPFVAIEYDVLNKSTKVIGAFENLAAFEEFIDQSAKGKGLQRRVLFLADGNEVKYEYLAVPGDNIQHGNVGVFYLDPQSLKPKVIGFQETEDNFVAALDFLLNNFSLDKVEGGAPDLDPRNYIMVEFNYKKT